MPSAEPTKHELPPVDKLCHRLGQTLLFIVPLVLILITLLPVVLLLLVAQVLIILLIVLVLIMLLVFLVVGLLIIMAFGLGKFSDRAVLPTKRKRDCHV